MAVEAFLILWWTLKFPVVAVLAFTDRGPVRTVLHVFVAGRAMTVYTITPFMDVLAVVEIDDFFLDHVSKFEDIFMTLQTPLRGQIIVGDVFIRDNRMGFGMAVEAAGVPGRMSFGFLPQLKNLRVALSAGRFMPGRVSGQGHNGTAAPDEEDQDKRANDNPEWPSVSCSWHYVSLPFIPFTSERACRVQV